MKLHFAKTALTYVFGTVALAGAITASADERQLNKDTEFADIPTAEQRLPRIDSVSIDQITAEALNAIAENDLPNARGLLRNLVERYPDYHLGQLLLAELHAANISTRSALSTARMDLDLMGLLLEAQARQNNRAQLLTPTDGIDAKPKGVLKIGTGVEFWIQVDLEQGTQTVYEIKGNEFIPHWRQYVGYGAGGFSKSREGDLKTPLGVYRINGYRDDANLPELYGSGALMLDYPNAADNFEKRTGSGIWLHGVPRRSRSRGPLSSEGCVTMGNDYLSAIVNLVDPTKTLVALSASTTVDAQTVHLEDIKRVFDHWTDAQSDAAEISQARPLWRDVTVAVSGAGAIDSEAQEVVIYFPAAAATQKVNRDDPMPPGLTALFLKRTTLGRDQWQVMVDELNHTEI